jgi:type II pantothenate kinase
LSAYYQNLTEMLDTNVPAGADIGGTLAKMAMALPDSPTSLPKTFGASGITHQDLSFLFNYSAHKRPLRLHFITARTDRLAAALNNLCERKKHSAGNKQSGGPTRRDADDASPRALACAGGGAHKYGQTIKDVLGLTVVALGELDAAVAGLRFLHQHGPADEVFQITPAGEEQTVPWPSKGHGHRGLYPCLFVMMGSGVSIIRVDQEYQGSRRRNSSSVASTRRNSSCADYQGWQRVAGTACGGATFLGLSRILAGARTYEDALRIAAEGDANYVDTLVGDIYGSKGAEDLGLPATLTAANFGKLARQENSAHRKVSEADLTRATLEMVAQASALLARAIAHGMEDKGIVNRIFFAGGFLEHNPLARAVLAKSFRRLNETGNGGAHFLRHSYFLGALGCLDISNDIR